MTPGGHTTPTHINVPDLRRTDVRGQAIRRNALDIAEKTTRD